ncbi:MAG: PepSY-like domain-containing protein [Bacteroidales bacterium]|nr:PepSY-like domain-containing protein [Bacteroidales bacterium]MDE5956241.1 PepSY-like domain-containing protein [Bacteroidales bacterium]
MKRIIAFVAGVSAFVFSACADDRPCTFEQLPDEAKAFVNSTYQGVEVMYVTKDDDIFRPDYNVMLTNGIIMEFSHSGSLKKIEAKKGSISPALIPEGIRKFVDMHYPDAEYVEYEIGRKTYEVKLSNRLELKFNSAFHIIEVDD